MMRMPECTLPASGRMLRRTKCSVGGKVARVKRILDFSQNAAILNIKNLSKVQHYANPENRRTSENRDTRRAPPLRCNVG